MKKIGLALGGGGAKGLAHIPMLEVLDKLGVRPHRIVGTSIGAVMGGLYASGHPADEIRRLVRGMVISKGESFKEALKKKDILRWIEFLDWDFRGHAIFKGDRFIDFLYGAVGVKTFEELQIPLQVVATDFWRSAQVVFDSGDLLSAIKASMGLPGVFTPVQRDGRVLIDGGGVNPVPHDLLTDCDLVIAVDVMGRPQSDGDKPPNLFRAVLGTFDIMQNSIIAEKLNGCPPDIYVKPDIVDVDILEFYKANEVYQQAEVAQQYFERQLVQLLERT